MQMTRKKRVMPDLDVGPFSDIAFLLIIFFILTTTFVKPAGEKLQMPAGQDSKESAEDKTLTIGLKGDTIRFGKGDDMKPVALEELKILLEGEGFESKGEAERNVIIDSDKSVLYETYFRVVMAVTKAGGVVAIVDKKGKKE
ncbi:MAG: ExbD/TolR family protein [Planctomycetota bacterium]|jgi:biopolymer transport protein ExbD